ncbi:MAG: hypothetical protein JSV09_13735, partial [Thermoplasmata archaeon]
FPQGDAIEPLPSSWSTTKDDIANANPYPLWRDPQNNIHSLQWESLDLASDLVKNALAVADNDDSKKYANISRLLLDRAFHSDQMWWASKRPWWDINMIANGLFELFKVVLNAYRAIKVSGTDDEAKKEYYYSVCAANDRRARIIDNLFGIEVSG